MADFTEKTITELGAYVTTPKLTQKLLSKPPFRFLHDVIMSFMKATSFPVGLYSDDMLDCNNVTDKDTKIAFLKLLIAAIEAATGKTCEAKPQKILSGSEPENTNQMLQLLASCAGLPADKKAAAVAKAKGHRGSASSTAPAAPAPEKKDKEKAKEKEKEKDREKEKAKEKEKEKEKDREKEKAKEKEKEKEEKKPAETDEERHRRHEEERRKRHEEKKREKAEEEERHKRQEEGKTGEDQHRGSTQFTGTGSKEPAVAGKAPPKTKPTHEVVASQGAAGPAPAVSVITEAKRSDKSKGDEDAEGDEDWMQVAERYQQKSNAPTATVAGDVEVKGKLGQQALKAKRDQEEAAQHAQTMAATGGGGGIVISKAKGGSRGSHGAAGASMNDTELQKLREQLQLLTKASNPLGKFLEATHDDIDSMTRELETWRSEARNQAMAAAEARRQTQESLQEIQAQLQSMEDAISDQMLKTNNLRQTILANDAAIEGMLGMIVGPDVAAR